MTTAPRFSILVPTRDRPDLIAWCLESLQAQTWTDFEVIVSDNAVSAPCHAPFSSIADDRFHYVTPPRPLAMADNWEFALQHARGEYVSVLIDKSALLPDALASAANAVERTGADTVCWWNEGFTPEGEGRAAGWYEPYFPIGSEQAFDPRELLARRMQFSTRRGEEGTEYFRGKICFGVYARSLIEQIRARQERLFFPIAPDYTSRAAALWLATSALDLGRPLMLSSRTVTSNGLRQRSDAGFAQRFVVDADPSRGIVDALPISGLYASLHNLVGYDLMSTVRRVAGDDGPTLGREQLMVRAGEDLDLVTHWDDAAQEAEQRARLDAAIAELDDDRQHAVRAAIRSARPSRIQARAVHAVRAGLARSRGLRAAEVRIRRPWAVPRRAASIVAATHLAASRER